jgi:dipeptidyl aminopeptidase
LCICRWLTRVRSYFLAARPTPASRHVYSVDLPERAGEGYRAKAPVPLTDDKQPAYFDATFDPKGAYYLLSNNGPDVPSVRVRGIDDAGFELVLTENVELRNTIARYARPQSVFYTVRTADGAEVSVHEMRPHDFDASGQTRYPVLLAPYGGPNSQVVKADWGMSDWGVFLASSLGYIVCKIDGRGTGLRGRKYRTPVTGRLGSVEAEDMIGAMREMRTLPYVDEARAGIWGWSFGGYLTSKVLERDAGVFSLGMAVAPVSRWEFCECERVIDVAHEADVSARRLDLHGALHEAAGQQPAGLRECLGAHHRRLPARPVPAGAGLGRRQCAL